MKNFNKEEILERLSKTLKSKRFDHSVNVMRVAMALAKHYGQDIEKAEIAGLLHDCGRSIDDTAALKYAEGIGYLPDQVEVQQPVLLHGIIGAHIAEICYGINDGEILEAIRWHTTGKADMTPLGKIIYVADYIEPLRCFDGVETLRKTAFEDLDHCVVQCAESTIRYILAKGLLLHEKTLQTRNHCLIRIDRASYD